MVARGEVGSESQPRSVPSPLSATLILLRFKNPTTRQGWLIASVALRPSVESTFQRSKKSQFRKRGHEQLVLKMAKGPHMNLAIFDAQLSGPGDDEELPALELPQRKLSTI